MILEFVTEPPGRRLVGGPLIEHPADVSGKRHIGRQLLGEEAFALVDLALGEAPAGGGQADVTALELGEAQELQRFSDREEIVDFVLQARRQWRQVRLTAIGLGGNGLEQTSQEID